jgi:hypothetical protein
MSRLGVSRLSPCSRGEDEGEGFERIRTASTLTIPLSLRKGEATGHARAQAKVSAQT